MSGLIQLDYVGAGFDPYSRDFADMGFVHGVHVGAGYESHDSFVFDGWYGIGFGVRTGRIATLLRGGGGADVVAGGTGGIEIPFAFALGFDGRIRGWPHRRVGFEVGGGYRRRVPDGMAGKRSSEIRVDGQVLIGNPDKLVFSLGPDYRNFEGAHWAGGGMGFGW